MSSKFSYYEKVFTKIFIKNFSALKQNRFYFFLSKYLPLILTIFFIAYISYCLSKSEIRSIENINFKYLFNFFLYALTVTPIFVISSSIRFHLVKIIFEVKTTLKNSIQSILFSSSLEAFTPAKVNDFARLKNEKNRKKVFLIILLERLSDFYVLIIFFFFSNIYIKLISIFLFSLLLILTLDFYVFKRKLNFRRFFLFLISVLITGLHWQLAFSIFRKAFFTFAYSFNSDYELISNLITIKKFSLMTIISVLPIGLGGFGLREVSSLGIFNEIDSSLVLTSTVAYGLAVSGLLTFIGISYVNIRKIFLK